MLNVDEDPLILDGISLSSRLFLGTARYPDLAMLCSAVEASGAQVLTATVRRRSHQSQGILTALCSKSYRFLPNTAGCYTAQDAVLMAELAREAFETNWIKLEVIGDEHSLYPNSSELLVAAQELVGRGFCVFPYCTDDPVLCQQLEALGCTAVMPLAAPIGSGMGVNNPHALALIRRSVSIPVIVDAGIGAPSDVVQVMEMGVDAVLVNTAVAQADHPVEMARAMHAAVIAGRLGYLAGRIPKQFFAHASSPPLEMWR